MRCHHPNFKADVTTHRSDDEPQRFYIEVHIECTMCHIPFHFPGVKRGKILTNDVLSSKYPIVTATDGRDLRVPIACGPAPEPEAKKPKLRLVKAA
jgi:hypothetical protein